MKLPSKYSEMSVSLNNQQGTAIISALLILMLLSIVAITATNTTTTEKSMVRSEAIFEKSFFLAESAAMEGLQKLANESDPNYLLSELVKNTTDDPARTKKLLVSIDKLKSYQDDPSLVKDGNARLEPENDRDLMEPSNIGDATKRLVVQLPIASGSSLALGASRLYQYTSFGFTEANSGRSLIKVGYKKRF